MDVRIEELPPPILVESQEDFEDLLDVLEQEDEIAVDTEADSFYSFRDKVCLLQITARGQDWLVDPLGDLDLADLGPILADPSKTKVFHDAEYDVLILGREFGFRFAGLFDTRVAAAVLGSAAPGLASVLSDRFGVQLDKSQQRSNWAKRPLTPKQIAYARLDTRFLLPLMHEQKEELARQGRSMIVETECRRLEALEPPPLESHPNDFVKIKGARALDPKGVSALKELYAVRQKLAERYDLPPFRILGNKPMLDVARKRPRNEAELLRIEGITPKVLGRLGNRVQRALDRAARKGPIARLPMSPKRAGEGQLDEIQSELHDRLKTLRKEASERMGIESAYLLNRHLLQKLAEDRPASAESLRSVDGIEPWQLEAFGDDIVATVTRFERDVAAGTVPSAPSRRRR
ncbi:ribonuclease D [Saltatorellus ferox]